MNFTNKKIGTKKPEQKKPVKYNTKKRIKCRRRCIFMGIIIGAVIIVVSNLSIEFWNQFNRDLEPKNLQSVNLSTLVIKQLTSDPVASEGVVLVEAPTKERVEKEIREQAELFGVDQDRAVALAKCESGLRWDAKNPNSTARGVMQYLIGTWEETDSAKKGLERNNYKANIREAMIDLANGEEWRWDCKF